jgi:hypothetical protein
MAGSECGDAEDFVEGGDASPGARATESGGVELGGFARWCPDPAGGEFSAGRSFG